MRQFIFLIVAQLFEFFSSFKPLNNRRVIFCSTRKCDFNFNSKYLFFYLLKHSPDLEVYFIINDDELRKKLSQKYGEHFISTNTLSGLKKVATAKVWVTSVFENMYVNLPAPLWINKQRCIFHIGHGVPLKNMIMMEEKISFLRYISRIFRTKNFTHILSYSKEFQPIMERIFQNSKLEYIPLGQPRNDALTFYTKGEQLAQIKSKYQTLPAHDQAILYAPTWRFYDTVKFFPFDDLTAEELNERLIKNNTVLFLRKHPYFPSLIDESYLEQSNIYLFDSDLFPEVMDYLSYFDKLITDYSSIYLDFLCLNRPMAFIPYDLDKYIEHTGFTMPYEALTPGRYLYTKDDFFKFITDMDDDLQDERARVAKLVNAKNNGNCEENYQFILQLLNGK